MARPTRSRKICREPLFKEFAPVLGVSGDNAEEKEAIVLSLDEYEVIRMVDLRGVTHEQCAAHMGISRTTVTEIYEGARRKIADMIVNGKSLHIEGGNCFVCNGRGKDCSNDKCIKEKACPDR
ncbi:MAG: DUF134 domain-containing protein [Lachnospiraceae bacterium]|nr:DUF134 domain-containing protein [Lachnospiraceae bacterium]